MVDYEVWLIGVTDENARFVALVSHLKHSEAKTSQFFAVFDISIALVTRSDAKSRDLAILVLTDKQTNKQTDGQNRLLYPLSMRMG